jgi:hypothetical protein
MPTDAQVEAAARAICRARDLHPDTHHQVMPGDEWDTFPEDGNFINSHGQRCKLVKAWRKYVTIARIALAAAEAVDHE